MSDLSPEMRAIEEKREAVAELERQGLTRPPAPDIPPPVPQPLWRRALKLLVFLLVILAGAIAGRGRPENGLFYKTSGELVYALAVGVFGGLFWLVIVGSVGHVIATERRKYRRWRASVTTFPALLVTFFLFAASAAGRAAHDQQAVAKATPNPSGSPAERKKANLEAGDWARSRGPVMSALKATGGQYQPFLKELRANGNTPTVRKMAERVAQEYAREQTRWRALPETPLAELRQIDAQVAGAIGLASAAYADYVAGLKANVASGVPISQDKGALALFDSGDAKLTRADRKFKAVGRRLLALDNQYGIP